MCTGICKGTMKLVLIVLFGAMTSPRVFAGNGRASCAEVRRVFHSKRIGPMKMVPFRTIKPKNLQICSSEMQTCCNRRMERKYQLSAENDYAQTLEENFSLLEEQFTKFLKDFEDDYKESLSKSEIATITLINSTLSDNGGPKLLEKVNAVFDELVLLHSNRVVSTVNLKPSLERLFLHLFVSTFEKQTETQSTKKQSKCIANEVEKMPYPEKLTNLLRRSAIFCNLTTTFLEAVRAGADVLKTPAKTFLNKHCVEDLVKMRFCSHCYSMTLIKPCKSYCRHVLRGCMVDLIEIDRYWRNYVTGLNIVVGSMFEKEVDPQNFFDEVTNSVKTITKFIFQNETVNEIKETCIASPSRSKRSSKNQSDDLKPAPHHRRRHHRSRNPTNERTFSDLNTETNSNNPNENQATPNRLIPPPHKMLVSESSKASRSAKKQSGKKKQHDDENVELQSENALLQPKRMKLNLKSKMKRFVAHQKLLSGHFSTIPDNVCKLHYDSALRERCWDGNAISDNDTVPVVKKGLQYQVSNPEVPATEMGAKTLKIIENLQEIFQSLMQQSGKTQFSTDLPAGFDYVIQIDESDVPCDDEDECAASGSGDEVFEKVLSQNRERKRKQNNRNKHFKNRRKISRNRFSDSTLNIMTKVDGEISNHVYKEDKSLTMLSQGGSKESQSRYLETTTPGSSSFILAWRTLILLMVILQKLVT